jgi:hypothetical protein
MSTINKQRIAAELEQLGYTFAAGDWMHPTNDAAPISRAALRAQTKSASSPP